VQHFVNTRMCRLLDSTGIDDYTLFEQVVAYLLKASHNFQLDCMVGGKKRSHQFDGYVEEFLIDQQIMIRIGIECKKWATKVPVKEVADFARKIKRCRLDKGIMISYSGFQSGAIDEGRESNIALFEFRPCKEDDFRRGTKIVNFDPIGTGHWHVRADLRSRTPLDNNKEELSSKSIHDVEVYDSQDMRVGRLSKIVSDLLDREMIYHGRKKGNLKLDWSEKGFHFHTSDDEREIIIAGLEIDYELPITEIKPLIAENWYIMKNVLDNSRKIIMASKVKEIESLFE
jgi:hypothetical protein